MNAKILLTLILFFTLTNVHASVQATALALSDKSDSITLAEEQEVLLLLNNFCGDAWCEGSYDIQFKSIQFNPSHEVYILAAATTADRTDESTANSIGFYCSIDDAEIILDTLNSLTSEAVHEAEKRLFKIVSRCIDTALYLKP